MNDRRTSWPWRGRVLRDSASAIGCVRERMRAGGCGRGSIILTTGPVVDRWISSSLMSADRRTLRHISHIGVKFSDGFKRKYITLLATSVWRKPLALTLPVAPRLYPQGRC